MVDGREPTMTSTEETNYKQIYKYDRRGGKSYSVLRRGLPYMYVAQMSYAWTEYLGWKRHLGPLVHHLGN